MSANAALTKSTIKDGFLGGFIEGSVEMLVAGLYGDCTIHCRGDHSQYGLMVRLKKGMMEGAR